MARKALIVKQRKKQQEAANARANGRKPDMPTRLYNRCSVCSRRHGYMRFFGICRICFREYALKGEVPGVKKSSW